MLQLEIGEMIALLSLSKANQHLQPDGERKYEHQSPTRMVFKAFVANRAGWQATTVGISIAAGWLAPLSSSSWQSPRHPFTPWCSWRNRHVLGCFWFICHGEKRLKPRLSLRVPSVSSNGHILCVQRRDSHDAWRVSVWALLKDGLPIQQQLADFIIGK